MNFNRPATKSESIFNEFIPVAVEKPFVADDACMSCRQVHSTGVKCEDATRPCSKCGKQLRYGERWQLPNEPDKIFCAEHYREIKQSKRQFNEPL